MENLTQNLFQMCSEQYRQVQFQSAVSCESFSQDERR